MSRNDTDWSFNLQLSLFHYLNLVQMSPKLLTCSLRFSHFYIYFLAICLLIQPVVTVFFYLCLFFLFSFLSSGFVGSFLHFSLFSFSSSFFFLQVFFCLAQLDEDCRNSWSGMENKQLFSFFRSTFPMISLFLSFVFSFLFLQCNLFLVKTIQLLIAVYF